MQDHGKLNLRRHFGISGLVKLVLFLVLLVCMGAQYRHLLDSRAAVDATRPALFAATDLRYQISEIQQFVHDAAVTGNPASILEADRYLQRAQTNLSHLTVAIPAQRPLFSRMATELIALREVGQQMRGAYRDTGVQSANRLIQAPLIGFDARTQRLIHQVEALQASLNVEYANKDRAFAAQLKLTGQIGLVLACAILLGNLLFSAWTYRRLLRVLGDEPDRLRGQLVTFLGEQLQGSRTERPTDMASLAASIQQLARDRESASQAAEAAHSLLANAIDSLDAGFLMYDRDGKLMLCNEAFRQLYPKLSPFLVTGRPIVEMLAAYYDHAEAAYRATRPDEFGVVSEAMFIARWLGDDPLTTTENAITIDGRHVTLQRATAADGTTILLRVDVTEWVKLNAALSAARDEAEQANASKSAFLANMSHEIRTPMNGVQGMIELVLESELSNDQRDYLTMARSSAESLMVIINDILDFSKIEAGKLDIECIPFSLRTLLSETLRPMAMRAASKQVALDCAISPHIPDNLLGDPSRIRQIVTNLLSNALKFTDQGEISLEAELLVEDQQGVRLTLTVRDTGIGISAEKLALIFAPFSQAETSTARRFGGTGLGLTISKRLCTMLGGTMTVTSTEGEGSAFCAELLLQPGEPASINIAPATSLAGKRALVIESNPINRAWLASTLRGWGLDPVSATHAEAGRIALSSGAFDFVLLDNRLRDGSGFEMLPFARQSQPTARILMLVSFGVKGDAARSQALGGDGYLTKPLGVADLREALCVTVEDTGQSGTTPRLITTHALQEVRERPHVLLAEDNEINQQLALRLLDRLGLRVTLVTDGEAAVEAARSPDIQLVLMDMQMPKLDGLEASRAIRHFLHGSPRYLPIIALTAHTHAEVAADCAAAGIEGYAAKPIRAEALQAEISRLLALAPKPSSAAATVTSPSEVHPDLRDFDGETLLASFDNDLVFFGQITDSFWRTAERMLGQIDDTDPATLAQTTRFAMHALKGAAATLGAKRVQHIAQAIETALQSDPTQLGELHQSLQQALADLRIAINGFLERVAH